MTNPRGTSGYGDRRRLLVEHPDGFDFEFSQGSSLAIDLG